MTTSNININTTIVTEISDTELYFAINADLDTEMQAIPEETVKGKEEMVIIESTIEPQAAQQTLMPEAVATPAPAPTRKSAHKGSVEEINLAGIGPVFAKGNLDIICQKPLISMCISARADANGKEEMEKMTEDLANRGYNMVFSGVRPEDLWGINAALQHGSQVVVFSHQGIDRLMKNPAIPGFKQAFQQGNVLFLSFNRGMEDYSLEKAQRRNDAIATMCSGVYVAQALATQKIAKNGKKYWDGQGAWDLISRFNQAEKPVYVPCWNEEQPASMAVLHRRFDVIEVADGVEVAIDQMERLRSATNTDESAN